MIWKNIEQEKPTIENGKSEIILVADEADLFYIARMYESVDGIYFCNEENDTLISDVVYWSYINRLPKY